MKINWKKLIIITIITFVVGSFFGIFTMNNMDTYKELTKPFNVPGVVFSVVWSILYLLMSISCYIVSESESAYRNKALLIYWVQLAVNSLWSLIFFGFNAYLLAFIWIIILDVLVAIMIILFSKVDKKVALLQIPYLLWILFASYLSYMIYVLNP